MNYKMRKLYLNKKELNSNAFKNPYLFLKYYYEAKRPETYSDKELRLEQCFYHKNRGFEDLFHLTRTYFPNLKIDEFAYILLKFRNNNKLWIKLLYCPDVDGIVVSTTQYGKSFNISSKVDPNFEHYRAYPFYKPWNKYKSGKYSYVKLLELRDKYIKRVNKFKASKIIKEYINQDK